ncbi:hypothetical protein BCF59_0313 [Mycoplasmopsis mustelae]|uniref:Uncharacterized protein n=1 Tax=Mycoplasmopsis mustelae TaxID=171289 RepID=A0A4R7UD05_9BACT|nr:hypothetical protein [Mycoplasmopsis mustelae]TDV24352.1 hypothetical protein BCF59_0313 [Mycoplasmopsis mustelae]
MILDPNIEKLQKARMQSIDKLFNVKVKIFEEIKAKFIDENDDLLKFSMDYLWKFVDDYLNNDKVKLSPKSIFADFDKELVKKELYNFNDLVTMNENNEIINARTLSVAQTIIVPDETIYTVNSYIPKIAWDYLSSEYKTWVYNVRKYRGAITGFFNKIKEFFQERIIEPIADFLDGSARNSGNEQVEVVSAILSGTNFVLKVFNFSEDYIYKAIDEIYSMINRRENMNEISNALYNLYVLIDKYSPMLWQLMFISRNIYKDNAKELAAFAKIQWQIAEHKYKENEWRLKY